METRIIRKFRDNFFSISFDLVVVDHQLTFDLYINSSILKERERFVRIFPKGEILRKEYLNEFKQKYCQLYVLEKQREDYLKGMLLLSKGPDLQKTEIIKDTAIQYLQTIAQIQNDEFQENSLDNGEGGRLLEEAIEGCRQTVGYMVEVVKDYSVNQIQELIGNLSFHDFYTYDHSIHVSLYCISMFKTLKPTASKEELVLIGLGGLLHDLGKLKISTAIINKPEKLTDEEFDKIKEHPLLGIELLEGGKIKCSLVDLNVIKRIILEHHENYDGTGYPSQIRGKDIFLFARIAAIADCFDALTTKRAYHQTLTTDEALSVMDRSSGKKFDPDLFEILAQNVRKLIRNRAYKTAYNVELPSDFEPGQPYKVLPFKVPQAKSHNVNIFEKDNNNFGSVIDAVGEKDELKLLRALKEKSKRRKSAA